MAAIPLALPASVTGWLLMRRTGSDDFTVCYLMWGFCLVFLLVSFITSYCILEITETELRIRYPFQFLVGNYRYSLDDIESIRYNDTIGYSKRGPRLLITFRPGHEQEYFLGHRRRISHAHFFGRKAWQEIEKALAVKGIKASL